MVSRKVSAATIGSGADATFGVERDRTAKTAMTMKPAAAIQIHALPNARSGGGGVDRVERLLLIARVATVRPWYSRSSCGHSPLQDERRFAEPTRMAAVFRK